MTSNPTPARMHPAAWLALAVMLIALLARVAEIVAKDFWHTTIDLIPNAAVPLIAIFGAVIMIFLNRHRDQGQDRP